MMIDRTVEFFCIPVYIFLNYIKLISNYLNAFLGVMPRCPNLTCNTFYCVDSVIALKALLPEKSSYFNDLALENQGYDAIKDESITVRNF